ncbi:MAG TPA: WHG domain-containing protein [Kineosporiaceae bacterium]
MPRAGLTAERVVREAADLADEQGYSRLTLAALAERLNVRQPSLYKHIPSLDGLQRGVSVQAKRELGEALARSCIGRSGPAAVTALADTYRRWVREHPGRYAATVRAPAPGDDEDLRVSNEVAQVILEVLAGFGLSGDAAIDATRALRSALHGFVSLEISGGFGLPRDLDNSYRVLVDTLIAGFTTP